MLLSKELNSFNETLDKYYKYKSEYEDQISKKKKQIIDKRELSLKEKQEEYKKFIPNCINCKRKVSSIFTNEYDEEKQTRFLKAICGDTQSPCSLNITLMMGNVEPYTEYINLLEDEIKNLKYKIILDKNNLLFGLITSEKALENFEDYKSEITTTTDTLYSYLDGYLKIVDNKEKKEELDSLLEDIYDYIQKIKDLIKSYKKDKDDNIDRYIKSAVEIYVENIIPLLKKRRELEYSICEISYNADKQEYTLIKEKFIPKDIEKYAIEPKVIKYQMGVEKSKVGTMKREPIKETKEAKNKTLKLKIKK